MASSPRLSHFRRIAHIYSSFPTPSYRCSFSVLRRSGLEYSILGFSRTTRLGISRDRPWIAGHALLDVARRSRYRIVFARIPDIFAVGDPCAWTIWTGDLGHFPPDGNARSLHVLTIHRNVAARY